MSSAVESYDTVIKLDPTDTAAWYSRGEPPRELGRYNEAINHRITP